MNFAGEVLKRSERWASRYRAALAAGTALAALTLGVAAQAATLVWLGGQPGDENSYIHPNNWNPVGTPGAGDIATFNNSTFTNLIIELPGLEVDTFQFNAGAPQYSFNIIAGNSLDFLGSGIVNNSSFAPLITVNGNLGFTNNATAGNANILINPGGGLFIINNSTAGNANITANGTFIDFGQAFGIDTASAGNSSIVLDNSLLSFNASTTAGNATIDVRNGSAVFIFDNATGGNARFIVDATSFVDFSFSAGAGGLGIMTAGSIEGAGGITIGGDHNRFVVGSNNLSTEYSGSICGCSVVTFEKVGTGILILSGDNLYIGDTIITGGTLQLGNGVAASGSVTGNIINNSILSLNRPDNVPFLNNISGTGILNHDGTGNTTLLGNNTYTGATNINAGTLTGGGVNAFGNNSAVTVANNAILDGGGFPQALGSLAGGGIVNMGAQNLTVGGNNLSTNFAGVIGGTGALIKDGTGVLTLAGNNLYTGATTVNGGGLLINGLSASLSLTVNANAFVGGTGTLPPTTINGGSLSPGNSIGTVTIAGPLVMTAGSTYVVEVSPTAADRTNVIGTANIAGTVQAIPLPGSFTARTYTIMNATGGVTGTFSALTVNGSFTGARNPHLTYDANNVFLVLDAGLIAPPPGTPVNSTNVATSINAAVLAGATIPASFDALLNLPASSVPPALSQLTGEVAVGAQHAGLRAMDLFLGLMLNPFLHGRGEAAGGPALAFAPERSALPKDVADAYAAAMPVKAAPAASFGQRWSVWGSAYGGTSKSDGDTLVGSHDTRANAYGFAAGVDYRLSPNTIVGFALAGGGTNWSLSGGFGTGRTDMFQAGIYGSHRFGAAYISAAAAYTWHDASTERLLTLVGPGVLRSDFDANSFGGRIEGGYRWLTPFAGVTPYGALQVLSIRTPGYTETGFAGAAPFALSYASRSTTATRSEVGAWFDRSMLVNPDSALTLRARVAWAHDFNDDRQIGATFQTLPLASFTVFGASPAQDYALLSGAAELRTRNGWSFALKGDAEVAGRTQTYSGTGIVRYAW